MNGHYTRGECLIAKGIASHDECDNASGIAEDGQHGGESRITNAIPPGGTWNPGPRGLGPHALGSPVAALAGPPMCDEGPDLTLLSAIENSDIETLKPCSFGDFRQHRSLGVTGRSIAGVVGQSHVLRR